MYYGTRATAQTATLVLFAGPLGRELSIWILGNPGELTLNAKSEPMTLEQ
jgi:hypothetical protein